MPPPISRIIQSQDSAYQVLQKQVHLPDLNALNWVIENLSMGCSTHFQEIVAFKTRRFARFLVVYV